VPRARPHGWTIDEADRLGARFGDESHAVTAPDVEDMQALADQALDAESYRERFAYRWLAWLRVVQARVVQDRALSAPKLEGHRVWLERHRRLQDALFDLLYGSGT